MIMTLYSLYIGLVCLTVVRVVVSSTAYCSTTNFTVSNQSQLVRLLDNMTLLMKEEGPRCIQLSLAANIYDMFAIAEFVSRVHLTILDSLVVVGEVSGMVDINCDNVTMVSEKNYLNNTDVKIIRTSMVVFDGLQFTRCLLPIHVEEVNTVVIQNCVFRHSWYRAINIHNSPNVQVENCSFYNSSKGHYINRSYLDIGGVLYISYYSGISDSDLDIKVNKCSFIHNYADLTDPQYNTFGRLGGGLAILVRIIRPRSVICTVNNSVFDNNVASGYGGGLFAEVSPGSYIFENLLFANNHALIGGALFYLILQDSILQFTTTTIINCSFVENTAGGAAGAVNIYAGLTNNSLVFKQCIFTENTATSYGTINIESNNFFMNRPFHIATTFVNCIFDSNYGADAAAVSIAFYNAVFENVTFKNNTGRSTIQAIAGFISFNGSVVFDANNAISAAVGGAVYLFPYSQIILLNGAHVNFFNNTGKFGAAIVSESGPSFVFPLGFESIFHIPFCSIRNYDDAFVPFSDINPNQVSAFPGERIPITMVLTNRLNSTRIVEFHQLRHASSSIANATDIDFSVSSASGQEHLSGSDYVVSYTISLNSNQILGMTFRIAISIPQIIAPPIQISTFKLTINSCPPGHLLQLVMSVVNKVNSYHCKCNNDKDVNIVDCEPNEKRLILQEGLWATNINLGTLNGMMEYHQCPPGYCQCSRENNDSICDSVYYYDNDDHQCVCDRHGYLCGKCRANKGVSALLNNCVSCGYANIALIFALVVVDTIVITAIMLSSVSLFHWLYPSLFYLQITPYIAQYFPATFSIVQPYLHYISSTASLYFPYDFCLYPGMTALVSYSLRYIPVLLLCIIYVCIWIISRKYPKLSVSWSGLWLLILLLYTDVVTTSVSILNCPILSDNNGQKVMRWFKDGTVECFTGSHAALATFAILMLIVLVLLIIALLTVVLGKVKVIKGCLQLKLWTASLEKLLQEPFVDQCNWWAPTELIRRLIFTIVIMSFHRNLVPIMMLLMIYVVIFMYIQPYHLLYLNVMEIVLLGDILIMAIITSTANFKSTTFDSHHSFSIDKCGEVDRMSEHATMLVPFYFFPLLIIFILILKEIITKAKDVYYARQYRQRLAPCKLQRNISTVVIKRPIGNTYELKIDGMKEFNLILATPFLQQSAPED
ncbi:uncharacterized protein [Dysidea avara]|uniref:uncharacterized protein isoform X2 n=1 Tax=Dysidea avara TaxID=196820 RepID=UPI0033309FBA